MHILLYYYKYYLLGANDVFSATKTCNSCLLADLQYIHIAAAYN